jgi:hypothetical protein
MTENMGGPLAAARGRRSRTGCSTLRIPALEARIFAAARTDGIPIRGSREQVETVAQLLKDLDQPGK